MPARNPFRPSFGTSPPLLVGRDDLISTFADALDDGPGAAGRATLYTGARGVGKTVMLNRAEDEARQRGWMIVSETATEGFVDRIISEALPQLWRSVHEEPRRRRNVSGVSALGIGASWDTTDNAPIAGLRPRLTLLAEALAVRGTGVLITLDELHAAPIAELRELTSTIQHGFREDLEIAFAGAGLPSATSALLNDRVLTFLRRADHHTLGPVRLEDVLQAIRRPIESAGRSITAEALKLAADSTRGYPFMIQLVGHHVWRQHPDDARITLADARSGALAARRRLGELVVEPSLQDLSEVDRSFLLAMAQDTGPSSMGRIATRLGVDANYAGQYRLRLIAAEVIVPSAHGHVDFALPSMRDYLREHGALDAQRALSRAAPPMKGLLSPGREALEDNGA